MHAVTPAATPNPVAPHTAEIVVLRYLDQPFTYTVPAHLHDGLDIGSLVLVPFGSTRVPGVVVARGFSAAVRPGEQPLHPARLRAVLRPIVGRSGAPLLLPEPLLTLTRWVADQYLTPWGQVLRIALPALPQPTKSSRYVLKDDGERHGAALRMRSVAARQVVARLAGRANGLTDATLRHTLPGLQTRTLRDLVRRGVIQELEARPSERPSHAPRLGRARTSTREEAFLGCPEPASLSGPTDPATFETPTRETPTRHILERATQDRPGVLVLRAPAGHRRAWLLQAAEALLVRGRRVLILAPDIPAVTELARAAASRWPERVVLFHSGLSGTARAQAWERIQSGQADVVVGTRSAVFVPIRGLGLIYLETEEHPAFKEEQAPRYHAREVAKARGDREGALVLLGSTHPSIDTMGTSDVDLVDRFEGTPVATPDLRLVNLQDAPFGTVLSDAMQEGIADALAGRQGVLLFLNRRGFAPALLCRGCGQAPQCRRCSVTLTFHRRPGMLGCTYCGQSQGLPETCPACQAPQLEPVGFGTEQVEEEVRRRWPRARLVRLDRETAASTARAQAMRRLAGGGEFDIVIGTQMVLHGSCLPTVGFVGFPDADAGLHLPDFRAAERTYHALTDALSWLQATDGRGAAVLQTRLPSHHVIRAVTAGRPQIFYDEEMAYRRELGYPPFVHLISLAVSSPDPESARRGATTWATLVNEQTGRNGPGQDEVVVLGPAPAPLPRLRGRHRWHILVKGKDRNTTRDLVARTMPELPARAGTGGLKFDVDVDPVALM